MKIVMHIDFNSYFASVEQQANPRLRGKPIGVTGGDREVRTVLCTASIEAKKLGVKTGMQIWEAKKICPNLIIVPGDSQKYLYCTTKFLNILKDYTPYLEVFSIDECFLELDDRKLKIDDSILKMESRGLNNNLFSNLDPQKTIFHSLPSTVKIAQEIKSRLKYELGERITCSIGISYNKLMSKLAGSLKKPDGLVVIPNQEAALGVLDKAELDDVCGIGSAIKNRLFQMGIRNFKSLRQIPKEALLASFKSYGEVLYNMARGIDFTPVKPFLEREEVKSIGHRHTLDHDTADLIEINRLLFKISEMAAKRLRDKGLIGKTIHCWYRQAFSPSSGVFQGGGMQKTLNHFTSDGLEITSLARETFGQIWNGEQIRMVGIAISNLKPFKPANLSWLPEEIKKDNLTQALDKINNKFGNFTVQKGALLGTENIKRHPNPFLSDRRFKL